MITPMDRKFPCAFWENTFLNIFHMSAIDTNRNIKFAFTGHSAGMTADTLSVIYDKSVIQAITIVLYTL